MVSIIRGVNNSGTKLKDFCISLKYLVTTTATATEMENQTRTGNLIGTERYTGQDNCNRANFATYNRANFATRQYGIKL